MSRKSVALVLAVCSISAAAAVNAKGDNDPREKRQKFTIALIGDVPYGALGKAQYPALIADINDAKVAFTMHDGDLKSGGDGPCTDDHLYLPALNYFSMFKQPLVFVVGDNDWTDCWGLYGPSTTAPGWDDPLWLLQHERELFFSTPDSLGRRKLELTRQSDVGGQFVMYSENQRWQYGDVVFIGVNVQGSNDNYPYAGFNGESRSAAEIDRMRAEQADRFAAVTAWIEDGFTYAKSVEALGVVVVMQANLNFNNERVQDPRAWDRYPAYWDLLRQQSLAFEGQVLLVHGDAHYYHQDKPLNHPNGGVLANFTRVETFGARNSHWVKLTVDPGNENLFVLEPQMVSANIDK